MLRIGPSGLGGVKEAVANLQEFSKHKIKACEIAFTYGVYIKTQKDAEEIGQTAKKLDITLSIHAPYYINLNSDDPKKVHNSKQRILECCKVGTWLGVKRVVFHAGFYGKNKESAYENIKKQIQELIKECKEKKYTPQLCPEIMGKINVFGSIEEIHKLSEETGCGFCIDFAHILARYKDYKFEEVLNLFKTKEEIQIHFSGIEYGEKGEKNHKDTTKEDWKNLLNHLPKNRDFLIISESPNPFRDAIQAIELSS